MAKKKQPRTGLRSSSTSSKKSIKQVDKSPRRVLYSLNIAKNLPFLQQKCPKLKMYKGVLLGGEANFAINTVVLFKSLEGEQSVVYAFFAGAHLCQI